MRSTALFCLMVGALISAHSAETPSLNQLLAQYTECVLPLPPDGAVLCIHERGGRRDPQEDFQRVLIALEKPVAGRAVKCLVGVHEFTTNPDDKLIPLQAAEANATRLAPVLREAGFETNAYLAMAMQCKARGWDAQATQFFSDFKRFGKTNLFHQPQTISRLAWQYWRERFALERGDRTPLVARMKKLLDSGEFDARDTQLVEDMAAALAPQKPNADENERLIDALVDYQGSDEALAALKKKGFDAVPALLEHFDDSRVTRQIHKAMMKAIPRNGRVSECVRVILGGLRCDCMTKDDARRWWNQVSDMDEEQYLLSHVFNSDPKYEWPNNGILIALGAKYPERLPELYRLVLEERAHMQSYPFAEAIVATALPREKKIEALVLGAKHTVSEHRRAAMFELLDLNYEGTTGLLVKFIDDQPNTPRERYWYFVGVLTTLTASCGTPEAWVALARLGRRADVGTRLELLQHLLYPRPEETPAGPRIAFAREFLSDERVRDRKSDEKMFDGPCAYGQYERISVRDVAANVLASLLKIDRDDEPAEKENEKNPDWSKLRERVAAKLREYDNGH